MERYKQVLGFHHKGIGWLLGNGNHVNFWCNNWLPYGIKLINMATYPIPDDLINHLVKDFVSALGMWNWNDFGYLLPHSINQMITNFDPSNPN